MTFVPVGFGVHTPDVEVVINGPSEDPVMTGSPQRMELRVADPLTEVAIGAYAFAATSDTSVDLDMDYQVIAIEEPAPPGGLGNSCTGFTFYFRGTSGNTFSPRVISLRGPVKVP